MDNTTLQSARMDNESTPANIKLIEACPHTAADLAQQAGFNGEEFPNRCEEHSTAYLEREAYEKGLAFAEKARELEKRAQQQGKTLEEMYRVMLSLHEQGDNRVRLSRRGKSVVFADGMALSSDLQSARLQFREYLNINDLYEVFNFDSAFGGKAFYIGVDNDGAISVNVQNIDDVDVFTPWDITEDNFQIGESFDQCCRAEKKRMDEFDDENRTPSFLCKKI
jgi:hypothetical protein